MRYKDRARAIVERVLEVPFEHWVYVGESPVNTPWTIQAGWEADLRYYSAKAGNPARDHEAFLQARRSNSSTYQVDVVVDEELVLSALCVNGQFKVASLKRGTWETRLFGLPSPKSKRSRYFCDVSD